MQSAEFFLFAGIMGIAAIVFTLLALPYEYVETHQEKQDKIDAAFAAAASEEEEKKKNSRSSISSSLASASDLGSVSEKGIVVNDVW